MKTFSLSTVLLIFGLGFGGTITAMFVKQIWADQGTLPSAMPEAMEKQYPDEFKSMIEIGSRFPDEDYRDHNGVNHSFHALFASGPTVLLFWSLKCQPCLDQIILWDSVMHPALLQGIQEVVCLPSHYRDSTNLSLKVFRGKKVIYFDDERFDSLYNFVVLPMIIAVDSQGFLSAIQYEYSQFFTEDLIESVTRYEVGPCAPIVGLKGEI